jgi:hypothetical protein
MSRLLALAFLLGSNMAFPQSLVLMSEMQGQLLDVGGEPVAEVRLVRSWDWAWRNHQGSDETITDADGRFCFPAVTGRSLTARILPHEPAIRQRIIAHHAGEESQIWSAIKRNYREGGELAGRPLRVRCGLTAVPGAESQRLFASLCVEPTEE